MAGGLPRVRAGCLLVLLGAIVFAMIMGAVMPGSVTGALINDVEPDIDDEGLDDIIDYVHPVDKIFADWQAAVDFLNSCFPNMSNMDDQAWMRAVRRTCRERPCGRVVHDWDADIAMPFEGQRGSVDL